MSRSRRPDKNLNLQGQAVSKDEPILLHLPLIPPTSNCLRAPAFNFPPYIIIIIIMKKHKKCPWA